MSNREVIDQVDRGYRMAMPSHIHYPESRTMQKEILQAQVCFVCIMVEIGLDEASNVAFCGKDLLA